MGFSIKNKGGKDYVYFYLGSEGPYYLCPKDSPADSEVPNVFKALDYTTKKSKGFTEDELRLIGMLPSKDKDEYLSTRLEEIKNYSKKLVDQLSDPELKRQYSGDRTKVRPVKSKHSNKIIEFGKLCSDILNIDSKILLAYALDQEGNIVEERTRKDFDDIKPTIGAYRDLAIYDAISHNFKQGEKFTFSPQNNTANFIFPLNEYYVLVMTKIPIDSVQVGRKIVEVIERETKGQTTQTPIEEEDGIVKEERRKK